MAVTKLIELTVIPLAHPANSLADFCQAAGMQGIARHTRPLQLLTPLQGHAHAPRA